MSKSQEIRIEASRIVLVQGDITRLEVDAIVNAANRRLAGGGGVDGAIHGRGGPEIMAETRRRYPDGCPTGSAVLSGAGKLPARFVIHAVGPRWEGGQAGESQKLRSAYRKSLELAREAGATRVAFPAISAGIYGFPFDVAAEIALEESARFVREHSSSEFEITFCLFSSDVYDAFAARLERLTP